jgi:hypothetical protein
MFLFAIVWYRLNKNCGAEFVLVVSRTKRNAAHDVDLQRGDVTVFGNVGQMVGDQCTYFYVLFFQGIGCCILIL